MRLRFLATIIILILVKLNCSTSEKSNNLTIIDGSTMGTYYAVKIPSQTLDSLNLNTKQLQSSIDSLLDSINQKMSTYIEDSEISRFNHYQNTDWFSISKELRQVIESSIIISQKSGGTFDITVGPLVNLWGFGIENRDELIPTDEEVKNRMAVVGYKKISTHSEPSAIKKEIVEMFCDLSGIAKGYGVDKIAELLDSLNIENYLVDIGGEIKTKGKNHLRKAWKIGISTPDDKMGIQKVVLLENKSVATSGDYRNYFEKDGIRYSHTIDPRTGRPITHRLASVTVVHDTCMIADGLATAITVLGPQNGYEFALREELPVFMIVRQQEGFIEKMTPKFKKYLSQKKIKSKL